MKIVIIGAGGHARTVYECLKLDKNFEATAFIDNVEADGSELIEGIPVLGPHSIVPDLIKEGVKGFIIAVGNNMIRTDHFERFKKMGLEPINAIHPTATIAHSVKLGKGIVIGMSATINTNSKIGDNTIINTGAIIEHENVIEENIHVGPGCSIAGRTVVKMGSFIGIGCVVKDYITIGKRVIIGAGSVVLQDVPDNAVAVGSPARIIKYNNVDWGHKYQ